MIKPSNPDPSSVAGLVLAGGLSRRMEGLDKATARVGGETLAARALRRLSVQCGPVALNVNGDTTRFEDLSVTLIGDTVGGFTGPLAGVLSGLEWAADQGVEWLVTVPVDAPMIPGDLVERLASNADGVDIAVAASLDRLHPVVALWRVSLANDLRAYLVDQGRRRADAFVLARAHRIVDWPVVDLAGRSVDPFLNINTPDDLQSIGELLDAISISE